MIRVVTIDLAQRGVTLPSDRVGMVIAQPFLTLTPEEPYRCAPAVKAEQLEVLKKTLAVALARQHGAPKTHFTIFPEYAVPGLEGITLIDAALSSADWPSGTFVIGGIDALSKADFTTVATNPNTHLDNYSNGLDRVGADEWINCCITWVKGANETVERWLQPKLSPAWPEQNIPYQDMFHGRSVFAFKGAFDNGTSYRFSTLVCFDWIANIVNKKAWQWVVEGLGQQAAQAGAEQIPLSWFFVIQRNRRPSDDAFLNEVSAFFDQTAYPTVRRENACLVFANGAGKDGPGRSDLYGSTSLVFHRQTLFRDSDCHSTFCNGGARFRSSTLLSAFRDVLFRERGACIHSFTQVNPTSLNAGAAGKTIAIDHAFVFPLNGAADPRTPSAQVPACVKWLNDELDTLPSLSFYYGLAPLAVQAMIVHRQIIAALREIPPKCSDHAVRLASTESKTTLANGQSEFKSADEWGDAEASAIRHLVHTLNIIGLGFPNPTVGAGPAHAIVNFNDEPIDLLAIHGRTHEDCIKHSESVTLQPRRRALLVSRDRDNTRLFKGFGSFLETRNPQPEKGNRITHTRDLLKQLDYQTLLEFFRNSSTQQELNGFIYAEITA